MCLGTIAKPASNAVAAVSQASQNALTHRGKRNHLFGRADGDGFAGMPNTTQLASSCAMV